MRALEAAHRAVRVLSGWRIHGHPVTEPTSGEILLREGIVRGLSQIYDSKPAAQRDADIVDVAQILIVAGGKSQPDIGAALRRAQKARLSVIRLTEIAKVYSPSAPKVPANPANPQISAGTAASAGPGNRQGSRVGRAAGA